MGIPLILLSVIAGIIVLVLILKLYNFLVHRAWFSNPSKEGKLVDVGGYKLFARVKGEGRPVIVIETALGTPSFEWWQIQDELAKYATVVTYDRAGYGWSDASPNKRSSENIARELRALLNGLDIKPPYMLVGHSAGGLYIRHFACLYPELAQGCVFLDPMSPDDLRFKEELTDKVLQSSGVDKSNSLKQMIMFSNLGLLRLMRPVFLKSWLWQYYKDFPKNLQNDIFEHYIKASTNKHVINEYKTAHTAENRDQVMAVRVKFPKIPVKVIYHTPGRMIEETKKYGCLNHEEALKVEELWMELTQEYETLSPKSEWVQAKDSNHFIHLDEKTFVIKEILELWRGLDCHCKKENDNEHK